MAQEDRGRVIGVLKDLVAASLRLARWKFEEQGDVPRFGLEHQNLRGFLKGR